MSSGSCGRDDHHWRYQVRDIGGDASKATSAKNTILYAVVGLVVAAFAYAIVNFVVNEVTR